jgi:hypothetical protein
MNIIFNVILFEKALKGQNSKESQGIRRAGKV